MNTKIQLGVLASLAVCAVIAGMACSGGSGVDQNVEGILSGAQRKDTVSGTVSYRERLALTPGASLIVELQDTSYADAPSQVVASQTIDNPGQVPIKFSIPHDPDLIDGRNRYSVSARIVESDGRLAFTNATAYDVLTQGNPNRVEMLLILVEPPPDLLATVGLGEDWRAWQEGPADVIWANLIPNERVPLLRVAYYQSTLENCARPGNQDLTLDGSDIIVRLTLVQPPKVPWAPPCQSEVVELDTVLHVGGSLTPGRPYRVIVNDVETARFTIPEARLGHTALTESPILSTDVVGSESSPHQYTLRVVSGLSKGSGCSQFNGYEIRRAAPHELDVVVTHHEVADPVAVCTADFPIVESDVPLGGGFEPGAEYTVTVNGGASATFVAK